MWAKSNTGIGLTSLLCFRPSISRLTWRLVQLLQSLQARSMTNPRFWLTHQRRSWTARIRFYSIDSSFVRWMMRRIVRSGKRPPFRAISESKNVIHAVPLDALDEPHRNNNTRAATLFKLQKESQWYAFITYFMFKVFYRKEI